MELNAKTMPLAMMTLRRALNKRDAYWSDDMLAEAVKSLNAAGMLRDPSEPTIASVKAGVLERLAYARNHPHRCSGSQAASMNIEYAVLQYVLALLEPRPFEILNVVMVTKFTPETGLPEVPGVLVRWVEDGWYYANLDPTASGGTNWSPEKFIRRATPEEFAKISGRDPNALTAALVREDAAPAS